MKKKGEPSNWNGEQQKWNAEELKQQVIDQCMMPPLSPEPESAPAPSKLELEEREVMAYVQCGCSIGCCLAYRCSSAGRAGRPVIGRFLLFLLLRPNMFNTSLFCYVISISFTFWIKQLEYICIQSIIIVFHHLLC